MVECAGLVGAAKSCGQRCAGYHVIRRWLTHALASSCAERPTAPEHQELKCPGLFGGSILWSENGSMRQGTVKRVADQLGYGIESVPSWVGQADIDDGMKDGVTTDEHARRRELEQEHRGLKRANEILKRVQTTRPDPEAVSHPDLVNRVFHVEVPNRQWVTDLMLVPTWQKPRSTIISPNSMLKTNMLRCKLRSGGCLNSINTGLGTAGST